MEIVFIRIPKTGSTSITKTLEGLGFKSFLINKDIETLYDHFIHEYYQGQGLWVSGHHDFFKMYHRGYVPESFFKNSFKFIFVRNPYTRIVSLFHYLKGVKHNCPTFKDFCKKITAENIHPIGLYNRKGLSQCNPQVDWIFDDIDFIGKMENIEEDFQHVCQKIGIDFNRNLPHHRNKKIHNYDSYYDQKTRKLINNFYEKDFNFLGYKMKTT